MRNLLLSTLVVLFALHGSVSGRRSSDSGESRLQELTDLAERSTGSVRVRDEQYQKFVFGAPRPYHLFILFSHDKAVCPMCHAAEPQFEMLADSYLRADKVRQENVPIFFITAEYRENQQSFQKHALTTAPLLYYLKPTENPKEDMRAVKDVPLEDENKYDFYRRGADADYLADFVVEKTGIEFSIYRSPLARIAMVFMILATIGSFGYVVLMNLDFFFKLARDKRIWMVACCGFYWMSISGMVYCIIRNPPMFHQVSLSSLF